MSPAIKENPYSYTPSSLPTKARLNVYCGCGEVFHNIVDGEFHASTTGHTLHVTGEIRPPK